MTMGGDEDEFKGKFDIERLIGPFECTALFTKMKFGGYVYTLSIPFNVGENPDAAKAKTAELEKHAEKLAELAKK